MTDNGGAVAALVAPAQGRLIDPTLFTDVAGVLHLAGSACDDCATVTFPAQGSCPRCTGQRVRRHALASDGLLWAFTVQGFLPKPPYLGSRGPFRAFGVGYVDLGGEVLVESRLLVTAIADLHVGLPMRLVLEQLPGETDEPIWTFAFTPADGTSEPSTQVQGGGS